MSESPHMPATAAAPGTPLPPGSPKPSRRRTSWQEQPVVWYVLAGLCAVVLAGGGTPVWARALVLLVVGARLVWSPPESTPSRLFEIGILALFGVSILSSFAPASWFGMIEWRENALAFGVPLPGTNAPSPWAAAEALAQMLAGIAWLYLCWNLRLDHQSRKYALWGLAALTAVLALGAIAGNLLKIKYPLARDYAGYDAVIFTYFPNRNQSALWYCIGGVAAFGVLLEELRRRRGRMLLAGLMLLPCLLALVMGRSRMALALFALGVVLVVVVRLGYDAGNYLIRVLIPLGIFMVSLLVFFGDETMRRLPVFDRGRGIEPEFRLQLWRDTFNLAQAEPAGVGLNQFDAVFPQFRHYADTYQSVYHPDSDWMWLLGETGWAGMLAAAVAVGALVAIFAGKQGRASGPYRHVAALCAGLFLLHSLVDVPTHRLGTWLLAGWLIALAAPELAHVRSWIPRFAWRLAGLGLCAVGVLWLTAVAGAPTNAVLVKRRAMERTDEAIAQGDGIAAITAANQSLRVQPMQWRPFFQRARAELTLLNEPQIALDDFRRSRFIEPTLADVAYLEGVLWYPRDVTRAVAAWREAVQRADDVPEGLWRDIYDVYLRNTPKGEAYASALSKYRPVFRYEFLRKVSAARFPEEWRDELARDPKLSQYTPEQRRLLLLRWARHDGAAALDFLQRSPGLIATNGLVSSYAYAAAGHYREALSAVRRDLPELPLPNIKTLGNDDTASLKANFDSRPQNPSYGVALLRAQLDAQDTTGALATLEVLAQLPRPPPYVASQRAALLAQAGEYAEAWNALQPYIQAKYPFVKQP